jgi:hypothetical protein
MKKLLFLIFFITGIFLMGFSQITITNADMPGVGDTFRLSNTVSTGSIDFTLTGENYNWDFVSLSVIYQSVDTFVSVLSTPLVYQLVFFYPIYATLAQPLPDFDLIPGVTVNEAYNYFKGSNSAFTLAGYAFTVNSIPLPIRYDNPDRFYQFPLHYGNVDSSASAFTLDLPDVAYITTSRQRRNTADGWGTLTTPYGVFETLRLKSEVTEYDSVYVDSLNMGVPVNRSYAEYKWLANGYGIPLLQVTQEGALITVQYIDSVRSVTAIADIQIDSKRMDLFPNPCSTLLNVRFDLDRPGPVDIQIVNATGQNIWGREYPYLPEGENRITISVKDLNVPYGMLFLVLHHGHSMEVKGFVKE